MTNIDGKDAQTRKSYPVATGCLDYFPDALLEVARLSKAGNDQHNPGQPLHWSREKSTDHPDCLVRHFFDRGKFDSDGQRHSAKVAWRALAVLQLEIEKERNDAIAASEEVQLENTTFFKGQRVKHIDGEEGVILSFLTGFGGVAGANVRWDPPASVDWFYPLSELRPVADRGEEDGS
jgi:hypothetical protein